MSDKLDDYQLTSVSIKIQEIIFQSYTLHMTVANETICWPSVQLSLLTDRSFVWRFIWSRPHNFIFSSNMSNQCCLHYQEYPMAKLPKVPGCYIVHVMNSCTGN